VFERIANIERVHRERVEEFRNHPSVKDVRMLGTIAAIELRVRDAGYLSEVRTQLYPYFLKHGVLLRPLGNVIYTVPPYVVTTDDLHYMYDVIRNGLRQLEMDLRG
jgi:adenosylmethionine-8-amino-7-oxononanoate aminotransferase